MLIEGAPEPTCQKMLEGHEKVLKVEESCGGLRTDLQSAEIPRSVPVCEELSVVCCLVLVWDIKRAYDPCLCHGLRSRCSLSLTKTWEAHFI